MALTSRPWRLLTVCSLAAVTLSGGLSAAAHSAPDPNLIPTKDIACDKASLPEKVQGEAPAADYKDGRAAKGYTCNATQISHYGAAIGGYRVERYVDKQQHECAFFDSTLLYPNNLADQGAEGPGVYV